MGFALKPDVCRVCGTDAATGNKVEIFRRCRLQLMMALSLACNDDFDMVDLYMKQAAELLWPLEESK